jgi:outer membrane protein TolC
LRRIERQELEARAATASARLVRLLVFDPAVTLLPADEAAVPIDIFPTDAELDALVAAAIRNRPELAAALWQQEAAETRARQARYSPLIPRLQAEYLGGSFAGGKNSAMSSLEARGDFAGQVFWELRGLGFGNLADMRLRDAERDRAALVAVAARAQVASEVVDAFRAAAARRASLDEARTADKEAREMYRKLSATSFGMIGPRGQFDALEPLLAVQALNQSRLQLLAATLDYNRAQMRLLTAIGQPPEAASGAARGR